MELLIIWSHTRRRPRRSIFRTEKRGREVGSLFHHWLSLKTPDPFFLQELGVARNRDAAPVRCSPWLGRPFREFAPYGRDNVTKSLLYPFLVKTNLLDPMNVREFFCPFLQQNDRAGEAEASLKETRLVNDVLPSPHSAIRHLVL